jgi:hypothetical protein
MQAGYARYGVGVVVEDKAADSWNIKVWVSTDLPDAKGYIKENNRVNTTSTVNRDGKVETTTLNSKDWVTAEWLPVSNYNRASAPDVSASETVVIYRKGESSEYRWDTDRQEPLLRKKERAVYYFNADDTQGKEATSDTSVVLVVDTKKKYLGFTTPKATKEKGVISLEVNYGTGGVSMTSDNGNGFKFNLFDGEGVITLERSLSIEAKDVTIKGKLTVESLEVKGGVVIKGVLRTIKRILALGCTGCK